MGTTQFSGLTKKRDAGLDYEALVRSRASMLPALYAQKDAETQEEKTLKLGYDQLAVDKDKLAMERNYYNNMAAVSSKANQLMENEQMGSNILGLGTVGAGLYGAYKTAQISDKLTNVMADQMTPPYVPGSGDVIGDIIQANSEGLPVSVNEGIAQFGGTTAAPTPQIANIAGQTPGIEYSPEAISELGLEASVSNTIPALDATAATEIAEGGTLLGGEAIPANLIEYSPEAAAELGLDVAGAEAGTEALTTTSAVGPVGLALAAVIASDMARSKWGELDKSYEERGPLGKLVSASGVMGAPAAIGTALGLKEGNEIMKPLNIIGKAGENVISKPLHDIISLDPVNLVKDFGKGVVDTVSDTVNWATKPIQKVVGGCIIVTACTDPYSYEVEIARLYRDNYLDINQLRGYYALAELLVLYIERNIKVKRNIKKWLVDKLINYGEWRLGLRSRKPAFISTCVSKLFLGLIMIIGVLLPKYVRANGEVY